MKNSFKITAIVSSILLSAALAAPASAAEVPMERASTTTALNVQKSVVAGPADINFTPYEIPPVEHKVAPVAAAVVAPAPATTPQTTYIQPAATYTQPAPAVEAAPAVSAPTYQTYADAPATPAPAPAPQQASSGALGSNLAALAQGQVGIPQDCTAMVENVLRSVGKSVGDLAPAQFFQYGSVVGSPAPGDLVITSGHVAIYIGNGQVVSGGLNGMNTGVHSLSDLPGASFVRVS